MQKEFNTTGICRSELHYMMDTTQKMREVETLIQAGKYFIINRPRQYGKTTILQNLSRSLESTNGYLPIRMSFQGIDEKWYLSDKAFAEMFMQLLSKYLKYAHPNLSNDKKITSSFGRLLLALLSPLKTLVIST